MKTVVTINPAGEGCILYRPGYFDPSKTVHMALPLSVEDFVTACKCWDAYDLTIQEAFPSLTPEQREFILTGLLPEEWDEMFKEEDEDAEK